MMRSFHIKSTIAFCSAILLANASLGGPPIDARVSTGNAKLTSLGSSPQMLETPEVLVQDQKAGVFVLAKTAPRVDFAILPMQQPIPENDTWLFSAWGDIAFGSDDNFYVALGDHQALPGHAWVFQVNPKSRRIRTVVDVNKILQPEKGQYGPGKIHAPLIDTGDYLYFIPYRGSKKYCDTKYGFEGEHLMRFNYKTEKTEDLGIPIPDCSVAQMNYHAPSKRLYLFGSRCLAQKDPVMSRFGVYDLRQQKTIYLSGVDAQPYASLRCMMVAPDGRVWYMTGDIKKNDRGRDEETYGGRYAMYDPQTNEAQVTDLTPPGGANDPAGDIRAASEPDNNGVVWCISKEWGGKEPAAHHGAIFPFDTKTGKFGDSRGLCFGHGSSDRRIWLYTAVAKLDPSKTKIYYITGAHGGAVRHGGALIQYNTKTNTRKVLAYLYDHVKRKTGYLLGGTYGIAVSDDGSKVCINWMDENDRSKPSTERRVAVTIVHVPPSER